MVEIRRKSLEMEMLMKVGVSQGKAQEKMQADD
jgi:hypothetical protein